MFTAARAGVTAKTRKGRTVAVRPFTNLFISNVADDSIAALRLQRLMPHGIGGIRADLLATMIWGEPA